MIYIGKNIKNIDPEVLSLISEGDLFTAIAEANTAILSLIIKIRKTNEIDTKASRIYKMGLPYAIGVSFNNNIRNTHNIEQIHYLILDFDDCLHTPSQTADLVNKIKSNTQVRFLFKSPSGKGLKVWFKMANEHLSAQVFKAFYKVFASEFAQKIDLLGTVDLKTCDASRVCFLSWDPDIFYNPVSDPIHIPEAYFFDTPSKDLVAVPTPKPTLNDDTYLSILKIVNPLSKARPKAEIFVLPILQDLKKCLPDTLNMAGFGIVSINEINYGLKINCINGVLMAECNVFHGKQGFSVVKTTKTGSDKTFTDALHAYIYHYLFQ